MPLNPATRKKLELRLNELIEDGESILANGKLVRRSSGTSWMNADTRPRREAEQVMEYDWPAFVEWRVNCASLLGMMCGRDSVHADKIPQFSSMSMDESSLELGVGILRGLRSDLTGGFLGELRAEIEAEVSSDLLETAGELLSEGQHGPAGLLAGVVFEHATRWLCSRQAPKILLTSPSGAPIKLDAAIDALKSSGLYGQPVAAECRSWAAVRNKCAHGQFGEVQPQQVGRMIEGIRHFLATYVN